MFLNRLLKPHFVHRPSQIGRAIYRKFTTWPEVAEVKLPWGHVIRFPTHDFVGQRLMMHGIMSIEACEAAFRLVDPGDHAVDAGANVGCVTSALVRKVGPTGKVESFEMMQETFKYLAANAEHWRNHCLGLTVHNIALSAANQEVNIGLSPDFARNSGVAYATTEQPPTGHQHLKMQAKTLDDYYPSPNKIDFLKLDVERHELEVLQGAAKIISEGRLRDIVFEDLDDPRSPVKLYLRSFGYSLFRLISSNQSIRLESSDLSTNLSDGKAYDFLATKEAQRCRERFANQGYLCFG